jgi:hypothetical protein
LPQVKQFKESQSIITFVIKPKSQNNNESNKKLPLGRLNLKPLTRIKEGQKLNIRHVVEIR